MSKLNMVKRLPPEDQESNWGVIQKEVGETVDRVIKTARRKVALAEGELQEERRKSRPNMLHEERLNRPHRWMGNT